MNKYFTAGFLLFMNLGAQNYNDLIEQKNAILNESKKINKLLSNAQENQKNTLEELGAINYSIDLKEKVLKLFNTELDTLISQERKSELYLDSTIDNMEHLKGQYALLIKGVQLAPSWNSNLLFFLSSSSFNEALNRAHQIKRVEQNKRMKFEQIQQLKLDIEDQRKEILEKKLKKREMKKSQQRELSALSDLKMYKEATIFYLQSKKDSLSHALSIKREEEKRISDEIVKILESQIERSRAMPENKLISSNFQANKGSLPWPIENGSLVSQFGKTRHPVLSDITLMNNGIKIMSSSIYVRSVFDGHVTKIIILPDGSKVVIVRHGEYLTVYSNLKDVIVKMGEKIDIKEKIGILTESENVAKKTFGFQIWQNKNKLNPLDWLSSY